MTFDNTLALFNALPDDLKVAKEWVYDKCGMEVTNLSIHKESMDYDACSFVLNGHHVQHRISKITPTKTGQFVTLWKRDENGTTAPFDVSDQVDLVIITAKSGDLLGQFIFPIAVLADHGVVTRNGIEGKRGIRVYPPWDMATSKQAVKTQQWQTNYFLPIFPIGFTDSEKVKKLFEIAYRS